MALLTSLCPAARALVATACRPTAWGTAQLPTGLQRAKTQVGLLEVHEEARIEAV